MPVKNKSLGWAGLRDSIESVKIGAITPHPKNPRKHNEENLQAIMRSIKQFKQLAPVVVWGPKSYVIVGNGRLEAMKRLGHKTIEIVRADHLSKDEAEAYMIADNKTTDLSEFDFEIVAGLLKGLHGRGVDLSMTAMTPHEIEPLMQGSWAPPTLTDMPDDTIPKDRADGIQISFTDEQYTWLQKKLQVVDGKTEAEKILILLGWKKPARRVLGKKS